MALETNRYAVQKGVSNWENTTIAEMWTYLGIILLMGIHRLPRIKNYWSRDKFMGIPDLHRYLSSTRFWALWSNLHLVDNQTIANTEGISHKIQPLLDVLSKTFLEAYNLSQELAVDESMVKYKGCVRRKVHLAKKPIKWGLSFGVVRVLVVVICVTFSCMKVDISRDMVTGKKVSEKGLGKRVVKDLVEPFD